MIFAFRSVTGGGGMPFGVIAMNPFAGEAAGGNQVGGGSEWIIRARRKGTR